MSLLRYNRRRKRMTARTVVLGLAMALGCAGTAGAQGREIIGYFPAWKWSGRDSIVTPARLRYDKLTMINYAFFVPQPDGSLTGKDTVGDARYLRAAPGARLTDLAHANGVKVLLSLGGWDDSEHFPAVAASPALRAALAGACLQAMETYGFDGIDVDWEFPGYAAHRGTPADRENFTLLLRALRDSLTGHGRRTGAWHPLTAALPAGGTTLAWIDVPAVAALLDQLNVMTYDFYGPWDPVANHNAPLYPAAGADSSRSVDAAFRLYHERQGIPAAKLTLGIPFYGQTYRHCTALNTPHAGPDTLLFSPRGAFYYDIHRLMGEFVRSWDDRAQVPYLVSARRSLLISYDDERSIRAKARYILDNNIRGVIIWELTGDYLPDGTTPLLDAVAAMLRSPRAPD